MRALLLALLLPPSPARADGCGELVGRAMDYYVHGDYQGASDLARTVEATACADRLRARIPPACLASDPSPPPRGSRPSAASDWQSPEGVCGRRAGAAPDGAFVAIRDASHDCERVVGEAMDDYIHGNYSQARDEAERGNVSTCQNKAWRIIGASSCFLKDAARAKEAWRELGNADRGFVQYVCERNCVDLTGGGSVEACEARRAANLAARRQSLAATRTALAENRARDAAAAALDAIERNVRDGEAWLLLARASCMTGDAAAVEQAWFRLDEAGRGWVRRTCAKAGTPIPDATAP